MPKPANAATLRHSRPNAAAVVALWRRPAADVHFERRHDVNLTSSNFYVKYMNPSTPLTAASDSSAVPTQRRAPCGANHECGANYGIGTNGRLASGCFAFHCCPPTPLQPPGVRIPAVVPPLLTVAATAWLLLVALSPPVPLPGASPRCKVQSASAGSRAAAAAGPFPSQLPGARILQRRLAGRHTQLLP